MLNPSQAPDCKWHIGIPALNSNYLQLSTGGFNLNRILDATVPGNGDTLKMDLNKLVNLMSKNNYISARGEVTWLSGGFKMDKHYFHLSAAEKMTARLSLPRDLFRFIIDGNGGNNLGETFEFRFKLDAMHYREYAAGYSYNLSDQLQIGGRFKLLKGISAIQTGKLQADITTNPENYNYLIQSEIDVNTASTLGQVIPIDTVKNGDFNFRNQILRSDNSGVGFDLGATFKPSDKLTISASLLDMGYIRWNSNAVNLKSRNPNATYEFDGIYINGKDTTTDFGVYIDRVIDTVITLFRPDTTENHFNTRLNPEFIICGQYNLSDQMQVGALLYGNFYNRRFYPGVTANLMWKPTAMFRVNFSNSIYNRSWINPGVGVSLNLGAFQIYGVTDNFLAPILFSSTKTFSIRGGVNLVFGKEGRKERKRKSEDGADLESPSISSPGTD